MSRLNDERRKRKMSIEKVLASLNNKTSVVSSKNQILILTMYEYFSIRLIGSC
jgi:hypothetical protein